MQGSRITLFAATALLASCSVPVLKDSEDLNARLTYLPWNCLKTTVDPVNPPPCYYTDQNDWTVRLALQAPPQSPPFALRVSGVMHTLGADGQSLDVPVSWRWPVPRPEASNLEVSENDLFAIHSLIVAGRRGTDGCTSEEHCAEYEQRIKVKTDRLALLQEIAGSLSLVINRPQTEAMFCRQQCLKLDATAHSVTCQIEDRKCAVGGSSPHPYAPDYALLGLCAASHDQPVTNDTPASFAKAVEFRMPAGSGRDGLTVRVLSNRNSYYIGPTQDQQHNSVDTNTVILPSPGTLTSVMVDVDMAIFLDSQASPAWIPLCTTAASLGSSLSASHLRVSAIERSCVYMASPDNPADPLYLRLSAGNSAPLNPKAYADLFNKRCSAKGSGRIRLGVRNSRGNLPADTDIEITASGADQTGLSGLLLAPDDRILTSVN